MLPPGKVSKHIIRRAKYFPFDQCRGPQIQYKFLGLSKVSCFSSHCSTSESSYNHPCLWNKALVIAQGHSPHMARCTCGDLPSLPTTHAYSIGVPPHTYSIMQYCTLLQSITVTQHQPPLDLSLLEMVPVPEIGTPSLVRTLCSKRPIIRSIVIEEVNNACSNERPKIMTTYGTWPGYIIQNTSVKSHEKRHSTVLYFPLSKNMSGVEGLLHMSKGFPLCIYFWHYQLSFLVIPHILSSRR